MVSQNDEHGRNNVPFADYIDLTAAAQEKRATEYRWKLCEKKLFLTYFNSAINPEIAREHTFFPATLVCIINRIR